MASRFSQSSASLSNHLDEFSSREDGDAASHRTDSEAAAGVAAGATTSMAYLPQTVVLCDVRHEGFEDCVPSGPSESGLVSKWRPKDRVRACFYYLLQFLFFPFLVFLSLL